MRKASLFISAVVMMTGAISANATLLAYEGFVDPGYTLLPGTPAADGSTLDIVAASGFGFDGGWIVSNGNSTDSKYLSAGLSFPASYPGTFTAAGGHAVNKGNASNSMLRLNFDATTAASANSGQVFVSFLGQSTAPVTPPNGVTGVYTDERYQNPYPRNAGARFPTSATPNNNSIMGHIGMNGNAIENNGWGAWSWKSTHGVMSGADMRDEPDFVVVLLDYDTNWVTFWVNPQTDGSAEGMVSFHYLDGANEAPMSLYAFGVEAGSNSSDRQPGEWIFDEIRVATTIEDAAGFTMPVPEPSTYAAIFGFLALGLVYLRRRNK